MASDTITILGLQPRPSVAIRTIQLLERAKKEMDIFTRAFSVDIISREESLVNRAVNESVEYLSKKYGKKKIEKIREFKELIDNNPLEIDRILLGHLAKLARNNVLTESEILEITKKVLASQGKTMDKKNIDIYLPKIRKCVERSVYSFGKMYDVDIHMRTLGV